MFTRRIWFNLFQDETVETFRSFVFQNSNTLVWQNHPKLNDELFPYEDKRPFLRILRAQLSSAEQVLLYYNWKSGCGEKWEEDSSKPNGNHFFTDYRMIHNIIPKDCWAFRSNEILKSLLDKNPNYKKIDDDEKDTLFELIEWQSLLSNDKIKTNYPIDSFQSIFVPWRLRTRQK